MEAKYITIERGILPRNYLTLDFYSTNLALRFIAVENLMDVIRILINAINPSTVIKIH